MAVEARHLNLFPSQIIANRESMMNAVESHGNVFAAAPMGYGMVNQPSGSTTVTETGFPMYSSAITGVSLVKTPVMKSDSSLTYGGGTRKRSRDVISPIVLSSFPSGVVVQNNNQPVNNRCGSFTFLGEDISNQIYQQQLEIDRFIAQHTEKVRMEIETRRRSYSRRIAAAVQMNAMKKLKLKEEEMSKMAKLNCVLEERVKSLSVENQIWKDLAQTNEATANALRSNLERVLAEAQDANHHHLHPSADATALMDDAESCCGSNFDENDRRNCNDAVDCDRSNRMCRKCGREESCVLLLPCRHLCLCTVCGSSLHTCPVCNSIKTASVHVNLSS